MSEKFKKKISVVGLGKLGAPMLQFLRARAEVSGLI